MTWQQINDIYIVNSDQSYMYKNKICLILILLSLQLLSVNAVSACFQNSWYVECIQL